MIAVWNFHPSHLGNLEKAADTMKAPKLFHSLKIKKLFGLAFALWFGLQFAFGQEQKAESRQLEPNQSIEREMSGQEIHRYEFTLKNREFFQVRVEQKGVDVALKLLGIDGRILATMDSPNEKEGLETLSFVATAPDSFVLEVSGFDNKAGKGIYTIQREASRVATARDTRRVGVERVFVEAITARDTEGQRETALAKFDKALAGWQELQDDYLAQLTAKQIRLIKEAQNQPDLRPLPVGEKISRQFKGEKIHAYRVELQQGQVLQVEVQEMGINVQVALLKYPSAQPVAEVNYSFGDGRETLTIVVSEAGSYAVVVRASGAKLGDGYNLASHVKEVAMLADRERVDAERLFAEGLTSFLNVNSEGFREAVVKWNESLPLWKKLGEKYWEGYTNFFLGVAYDALGEKQKAIDNINLAAQLYRSASDRRSEAGAFHKLGALYSELRERQKAIDNYRQALALRRADSDTSEEAAILYNIGGIYLDWNKYVEALDHFNLALPLYRTVENKDGEAATLHNLGQAYARLGDSEKALKNYEQALPLWRALEDKDDEAATLHDISKVYSDLGEKHKALEYLKLALPLKREAGSKKGEAITLNALGHIYSDLGEQQTALKYLNLALPLIREAGDKIGEASTLNNIARAYLDLGEKQKALDHYRQACVIYKNEDDRRGEALALSNIGGVYFYLGNDEKAVDYLNQALPLRREVNDKDGEATTLNNIGAIYFRSGEYQKALDYQTRASSLLKALGSRREEATTLSNIGRIYSELGESQKALDHFNQALPLERATGDRSGEAITLFHLMEHWAGQGNRRFAIFYGKQSANKLQQLRERDVALGLDPEFQKSFVVNAQNVYQGLAELLIEEGQFNQAIQVLNFYQDQQFFDLHRPADAAANQTALSPRENRLTQRYEATSSEVGRIGSEIEELKRRSGNQPNEREAAELGQLEARYKTASNKFLVILTEAATEFTKPLDEQDVILPLKEVKDFQNTLQIISRETNQNTVALYTLIGVNNFRLLLVTPDSIKSFTSPIEFDEFNNKVQQFNAILKSDDYNPRLLGKELYDLIIGPAETELKKQNAQTLLWSLNGALRYVPMAALWDGEKYLVERYQNVVFTRAETERMTRNVSPDWTGTGFGTSRALSVDLDGDGKNNILFPALLGMTEELGGIFKTRPTDKTGALIGEVFADEHFTKAKFYEAIQTRRPVIHISSHFLFRPGDDSLTFLLLGDGTALTLNEMKKHERLFAGVELLTLSACETAPIRLDDYGKELDGFAELAQRLGAGSVIATLWQVKERSTAQLMNSFYKNRQIEKLNKAEALRKSQLGLLNGRNEAAPDLASNQSKTFGRDDSAAKDVVEKKYQISFKPDKRKPFAHPYYWSPFVLFGNWK
ncbi:MAG: tetratricopeptide repeat protein [Pyrinomonadaceae bacterium]